MTTLARLFNPKSIAIIGASASPGKAGYEAVKALANFPGKVYPINPKADEILGHKAYPSLEAIGQPVDLALLAIPAAACVGALQDGAKAKLGAALIVSGGFGESGEEGLKLQNDILKICHDNNIRLLGPNTSGFLRPAVGASVCFVPGIDKIAAGDIAVVAQSGGVNLTVAFLIHHLGLGVSLSVGLGNAVDVDAADVIEFLADDPATKAIALHLEGIADGRKLFNAISKATLKKPVVAITIGRADVGAFAQSHTGNLAGSYDLKISALKQAGAVVVDSTHELADAVSALARRRLTPKANPGIALLTGQAGPALLILDQLKSQHVEMPDLSDATVKKIAEHLPPLTYIKNPVDTGRPSPAFAEILQIINQDPAIDATITYAIAEAAAIDPVDVFTKAQGVVKQPLIFGTQGLPEEIDPTLKALNNLGVPAFASPERAARAVIALVNDAKYAHRRSRYGKSETAKPKAALKVDIGNALDEHQGKTLLNEYGFKTPHSAACWTRAEAQVAFSKFRPPLVVKVLDGTITHKSDVGGVHLKISNEEQFNKALDAIDAIESSNKKRGYFVEEMASSGVDLIIGGLQDPVFGPTVLLGLGGTEAEAIKDVCTRLAPLDIVDAEEMIESLRGKALLDGWRGAPAKDKKALAQALVSVSRLLCEHPEIKELDINPVRALPNGVLALDALVVL
ncbi:MAG: acetate--CoA ligase family protein [Gammaproteobacteria bacterium]|nr:acetate--CoA ligase family protein [Gammaproteobacteria bacterium]